MKKYTLLILAFVLCGGLLYASMPFQAQAEDVVDTSSSPPNMEDTSAGDTPLSGASTLAQKTYTLDADFDEGTLINVNYTEVADQLQLDKNITTFPFIWIALSGRGTVVKINTETITKADGTVVSEGTILGEYQSAPDGRGLNPSRTTVDTKGNVWVGNRAEGGGGLGGAVHIGLEENNQCVDRNGNGVIDTSTGLGDVKAWDNAGGQDNNGGVATAEDECIVHYVRVGSPGTRHVSVDQNGDAWIGGNNKFHAGNRVFSLIDGETGKVIETIGPYQCGGYGGLVDGNGVLWSAKGGTLRYDPDTGTGECLSINNSYGLAVDSQGNIWNSQWTNGTITKMDADGTVIGGPYTTGGGSRGVAVTADDNIWVANSHSNNVSRLNNDGSKVTDISVGNHPTGVAVDAAGKVWVTNRHSDNAMRIDPATNQVDLTVNLGGNASPYNYSDMTGIIAMRDTAPQGTWTVVHDSTEEGTEWGAISWTDNVPNGSSLTVRVRTAETEAGLGGATYVEVDNDVPNEQIPHGRYMEVEVKFKPNASKESPILYDLTLDYTQGGCKLGYDKVAYPPSVNAGEAVTVALTMQAVGECNATSSPVDTVLVIDRSGSMSWYDGGQNVKIDDAKDAAKTFINETTLPPDQIGVVSFAHWASTDYELGDDENTAKSEVDGINATGGTDIEKGLELAEDELAGSTRAKLVIVVSDGRTSRAQAAIDRANVMKDAGMRIVSIGLGNADVNQLKAIASSSDDYYYAPTSQELAGIYQEIATTMRVAARDVDLTDTLNVAAGTLITNTFQGPVSPTVSADQDELVWHIAAVPERGVTLTYQIAMTTAAGMWDTNEEAVATYIDAGDNPATVTFPIPQVTVPLECTKPDLSTVEPVWGCVDTSSDLGLHGSGFFTVTPGTLDKTYGMTGTFTVTASVDDQALDIRNYTEHLINATLPGQTLAAGKYDVTVMNTCQLTQVTPTDPYTTGTTPPPQLPSPVSFMDTLPEGFQLYPAPTIDLIRPDEAYNDYPTEIVICGEGFAPDSKAFIETTDGRVELRNQARYGDKCIVGTVPAHEDWDDEDGITLPGGEYKIIVTNSCGEATGTYKALDPTLNEDLWGLPEEIKTLAGRDKDPALCLPECEEINLGMIVRRRGGKNPIKVDVHFYEGDPDLGATLIGTGTIPSMSPGVPVPPDFNNTQVITGMSTSLVSWEPSQGPISYTLYAVLDPNNIVEEELEDNNVVSRTVHVLPCSPQADRIAPRVDDFAIGHEEVDTTTYSPQVSLYVDASDTAQSNANPSGLSMVSFVEYLFSESSNLWVPVQVTGWQTFTTKAETSLEKDMPLQLYPEGGVRFLQAWVSDQAGNVTRFPNFKYINYVKPCDYVARNNVRIYRQYLDVGDKMYVEVSPCNISSDPDLYIWPPNWSHGDPPWVSNMTGNEVESGYITATVAGDYLIEVYGYTRAEYNISIDVEPAGNGLTRAVTPRGGLNPAKVGQTNPERSAPAVRSESVPRSDVIPVEPAPFVESTEESGTLEGVMIDGPATGSINPTYTYTATVLPLGAGTVGWPITYTWEATGQDQKVHPSGSISSTHTVTFAWSSASPATKTITVTVADGSGSPVFDNHETVITAHNIYLPLVIRNS